MRSGSRSGEDRFFSVHACDRCGASLASRILSWFTQDVICMACSDKEREIRKALPNNGESHEGCGYIPEVSNG